MIDEYWRVRGSTSASLDALLSDNHDLCLADVLPAPGPDPVARETKQAQELHGALRRLSGRQRAALRRRYGLPGFGRQSIKETAAGVRAAPSAVDSAVRNGVRRLRSDARLRAVVGVE